MQKSAHKFMITLFVAFLITGFGTEQQLFAQSDSLWINKVSTATNYRSRGVQGILLKIDHRLVYKGSKSATPASWNIVVGVEDMNGFPLGAIPQTTRYSSDAGDCVLTTHKATRRNHTDVFIPFYTMDLPQGEHQLQLRISSVLLDSLDGPKKNVQIVGQETVSLTIQKPKVHRVEAFVRAVRVAEKNRKGKVWDSAFFNNGSEPDIKYAIVLASAEVEDYVFISTQHKNSFSAAWLDYSSEIVFSEGDELTLEVYDNDGFMNRDDTIGDQRFTLEQMINHTNRGVPISFDKVTFCDVSFRVIE